MKYNVEQMLEKAYCEPYFEDTDARRVYEASLYKAAIKKNKQKRRLVPMLGCVLCAAIIMVAVPPVRAAVVSFFESVGAYMSGGPDDRPAVAGVIVQTPKTGELTIEPGAENWMDGISVQIDEALFDGETLYLNYTVRDPNRVLTPESERKAPSEAAVGETICERLFGASIVLPDGTIISGSYDYRSDYENGGVHKTTQFNFGDQGATFEAKPNAELKLTFYNQYMTTVAKNSGSVRADDVGTISLPFAIDADAEVRRATIEEVFPLTGTVIATHTQSPQKDGDLFLYSNRPVKLDGTTLFFNEIKIKPTEIVLQMEIAPSEEMRYEDALDVFLNSLNYKVYADGVLLSNAYIDYTQSDETERTFETKLSIPFPPKEVREIKLVPYVTYTSSVNGNSVTPNGTFDFPETAESELKEQLLEDSAIVIDLSK